MIENASEVDVDFLLIHDNCVKLLEHDSVSAFFGDLSVHFFQKPEKKKLYSCSLKYTLVFAKIGEYFVSTPFASVQQSQNESTDLFSPDCKLQLTDDLTTSVAFQILTEKFKVMREKFRQGSSFGAFRDLLLEYFADFNLAIYRFGQKIPLSDISAKVFSLIHDAKLTLEIALGKELALPGFFVASKFQKEYSKFSYSVFLSNNFCNLRIDEPAVCQSFAPQSFHLANYNTFHHVKKDVNWVLQRESHNPESSLRSFRKSFGALVSTLNAITDKLDDCKSRVEVYFSISSIGEFREAQKSLIEAIKNLHLAAVSLMGLKTFLSQKLLH